MRIIAKSRLKNYWELPGNEHMQSYLNEWYHFCSKQIWNTPPGQDHLKFEQL